MIRLLPHRFLRGSRFANLVGIVSLSVFAMLPPGSFAQIESGIPAKLKVGAVSAPPFAMKTAAGAWEGLSIDLWQAVASVLSAQYEVFEFDTFEQLVDAASNRELDVAIGLAATEQREIVLDLSHPYFRSGSAIAVSRDSVGRSWSGFIGRIEIARIISVIGVLILLWVIAGAAVWVFESHRNREMFGSGLIRGLGHSGWWAMETDQWNRTVERYIGAGG